MERQFNFSPDEYYHIYSRGVDRRDLFLTDRDRLRFLVLLYVSNSPKPEHISNYPSKPLEELFNLERPDTLVDLGVYCLMPNHFHLLVREKNEGGISKFMEKILTGYSMYFNKRRQRTGALFERPFKARHVDNDDYLRYLFAYIHLNPVKINDPASWTGKRIKDTKTAERFLDTYRFSSYRFYKKWQGEPLPQNSTRPEDALLEPKSFPEYFTQSKDFSEFVADWIKGEGEGEGED